MANHLKRTLLLALVGLSAFAALTTVGYGYHDDLAETRSESIPLGEWDFTDIPFLSLDGDLIDAFLSLYGVATLTDLYANTSFQQIMDASSKTSNATSTYAGTGYTLANVDIEGTLWNIQGVAVTTSGNMSLGFLRQIDRSRNASNQPIHALMPPVATTSLPYPDYSYFTATDVTNSVTSDTYGFRLDNKVVMTTSTPVAGFRSLSFYALRGLKVSAAEKLANRTFFVQISTNGTTWSAVGTTQTTTSVPTANEVYNPASPLSHAFPAYSFALTTTQINAMPAAGYYVRLTFEGGVVGNGSNGTRSRMVVDDFRVNVA